jgi:hypothetical protein
MRSTSRKSLLCLSALVAIAFALPGGATAEETQEPTMEVLKPVTYAKKGYVVVPVKVNMAGILQLMGSALVHHRHDGSTGPSTLRLKVAPNPGAPKRALWRTGKLTVEVKFRFATKAGSVDATRFITLKKKR